MDNQIVDRHPAAVAHRGGGYNTGEALRHKIGRKKFMRTKDWGLISKLLLPVLVNAPQICVQHRESCAKKAAPELCADG